LRTRYGFEIEPIYSAQTEPNSVRSKRITSFAYKSKKRGPAIWLLAGIHGEEPAGPIAISKMVDYLGRLGQRIPLIVAALMNPLGNSRDYRYMRARRAWLRGQNSISDSSHCLPNLQDPLRPRREKPISRVAAEVCQFVLRNLPKYPPLIALDLHEDEDAPRKHRSYIYSQGPHREQDVLAKAVVRLLRMGQIPPVESGLTVSDETIVDGVVAHRRHEPIQDASIDELFGSPTVFLKSRTVSKPPARTVLVVETPVLGVALAERVEVHASIIRRLHDLFLLLSNPAPLIN